MTSTALHVRSTAAIRQTVIWPDVEHYEYTHTDAQEFRGETFAQAPGHDPMPELLDEWTTRRLVVLQRYLSAFTRMAKATGFSPAFIDAFSCADYCAQNEADSSGLGGFAEMAAAAPKAFLKHAVSAALATEPRFDAYMFIERDRRRRHLLEAYGHQFGRRNVQIRRCAVNKELQRISRLDWRQRRAVLFVDAYAGNLEWETICAVSRAQTIDVWLLLPLGFGAARHVTNRVPRAWRDRVSHLLQREDWFTELDSRHFHLDPCIATLHRSFGCALRSAFSHVAEPQVLRGALGTPLYAVYFGSNVPGIESQRGVELADHLLDAMAT